MENCRSSEEKKKKTPEKKRRNEEEECESEWRWQISSIEKENPLLRFCVVRWCFGHKAEQGNERKERTNQ